MSNEKLLALLKSSLTEDNILGIHMLVHRGGVREFMKTYGTEIKSTGDNNPRYSINREPPYLDNSYCAYFKIEEKYYLLINYDSYIAECFKPYNSSLPVVDLTN